jgi:spore coat protein CotH
MKKFRVYWGIAAVFVCSFFSYGIGPKTVAKEPKMLNFDYQTVFPDNKVNRIDINILPSDWQKLETELKANFGEMGTMHMPMGGPPQNGEMHMPPTGFKPDSTMKGRHGTFPGFPGNPNGGSPGIARGMMLQNKEMTYVPCTITFNKKSWTGVGFRVKGNSSLMHTRGEGNEKYPFRLKFDEFEDSVPAAKNQRFYGFNKLSFSNGIKDPSLMREKAAADLFRQAGVPAAHSAFYRVYINRGNGAEYFGLYTALEVVEDALLKSEFGDNKGNCYKPEGQGATFAKGRFDTASFEKKNNKKSTWDDVEQLSIIVNDTLRQVNPELWRAQLEKVFDVNGFLKWLAVNSVMQNWDTYGVMFHNFYLYNNPATGKLTWIPWDNNEALNDEDFRGGSLSHDDVTNNWPLIRYLLDVPVYKSIYQSEIRTFTQNVFTPSKMEKQYRAYYKMIKPYVIGAGGEQKGRTFLRSDEEFEKGVQGLIGHVSARNKAVNEYFVDHQKDSVVSR